MPLSRLRGTEGGLKHYYPGDKTLAALVIAEAFKSQLDDQMLYVFYTKALDASNGQRLPTLPGCASFSKFTTKEGRTLCEANHPDLEYLE